MRKEGDRCDFCMPRIRELMSTVGGYMTDDELKKTQDAIEALGKVCNCGPLKQTCTPLVVVHNQIKKNTQ